MLRGALVLVCVVKYMVQTNLILSPEYNDVLENSTLELTCLAPTNVRRTTWGILHQMNIFSVLSFSKEGACTAGGFLADNRDFETRCYSNATFKVKIKRVDISSHGQKWYCIHMFTESNLAFIYVRVPTKNVMLKNISGDVLKTVENIKSTLNCETSEGRPSANITWTKISKEGIKTDITHDIAYGVSRKETLTERNLTIVTSSIDIKPMRGDNGTRFICEATNRKSYVVRQELVLYVQYPPDRPVFVVDKRIVNGSIRFISGKNMSVLCKSDSFPYPTYHWNSTGRSPHYGQYLNITQLYRSDMWQCTATNSMTLPNETMIFGKNSAILKIHLLFPPTKPVLTWGGEGNHSVDGTLYAIRNDDVTILCRSNGDPAPHYEWIGAKRGAELHIASIQANTSRTCKVSNEMRETLGEVRTKSASTTVSIIVSYPPGIPYFELSGHMEVVYDGTFLRNKIIVKESNTFTITCKADGFPPPACIWSFQERRKSPDLTFTNITKDSIGLYTCHAENVIKRSFPAYADKMATSKDLEIDVLYQSQIETFYVTDNEKRNISEVTVNETVIFKCIVDSNPESEIVLLFTEKELRRNLSTNTLIYAHKISSCFDDGVYKCIAKNKLNSKPSLQELKLAVRCAPLASPELDLETNVSSTRNMTITFQFKAIAHPKPEFHWFKLSGPFWYNLKSSNKCKIQTVDNYSNLTVRSITQNDYGIYKLRIQNYIGSLEQLYFLKENVSPSKLLFTISENELERSKFTVQRSEEISFKCFSDSDLPYDEIMIRKEEGAQIALTKNTTSVRHTIPRVSCYDAGEYICSARNILAKVEEKTHLIIFVQCPPLPSTKNTEDNTVFSVLHSNVVLQFEVHEHFDESNNTLFIWFKHNSSLLSAGSKYIISSHGFQSSLVIRHITITDFGQYSVLVRNSYGEYIHFFELQEKDITKEKEAVILLGVTIATFTIFTAVLVCICYRHIRRERNDRRLTAEFNVNPTTLSHDVNIEHNDEVNHVYEQMNEHFTEEGAVYMEMQSIQSEHSTNYYITPTI